MVAYSFQKRFAPVILDGTKIGTIRAERKRHARVGEPIQLYQGMRTRYCKKIVEDPICTAVLPIMLDVLPKGFGIIEIGKPRWLLHSHGQDQFARCDGFADIEDMHAFWLKSHGEGVFRGFWVLWGDLKSTGLDRFFQ